MVGSADVGVVGTTLHQLLVGELLQHISTGVVLVAALGLAGP